MITRGRLGCLVLIAYPFVELTIAIAIASVLGWWWVLVFITGCLALGLGLVRYALGATGQSLRSSLAPLRDERREDTGLPPAITSSAQPDIAAHNAANIAAPAQTLLIVPAGLLIAVPGFVTGLVGAVLWLPPVRKRTARRWADAARRVMPPRPGPGAWPEDGGRWPRDEPR